MGARESARAGEMVLARTGDDSMSDANKSRPMRCRVGLHGWITFVGGLDSTFERTWCIHCRRVKS